MKPNDIIATVKAYHLEILGVVSTTEKDPVPQGTGQIILLGPAEPGFWNYLTRQPEWRHGCPDPIDRWSERAITAVAEATGSTALFPFSGRPRAPFVDWALRSGRAWISPVKLLVHDTAGLMLSFRGALAFPGRPFKTAEGTNPCQSCPTRPCLSACPAGALTAEGYDLNACHRHLDAPDGQACMTLGCNARRACPVSRGYGRLPEQSAHHMRAFHP